MKRKILATCASIGIGVIFASVGILAAADAVTPPEKVTINNEGYKSDKKGPVELSHAKHVAEYKAACTDCHHEYKDGTNVWKEGDAVKKCVSCHDLENTKDKVEKAQTAYHTNCKECHKKSGKDTAPSSKCTDCHAKS